MKIAFKLSENLKIVCLIVCFFSDGENFVNFQKMQLFSKKFKT